MKRKKKTSQCPECGNDTFACSPSTRRGSYPHLTVVVWKHICSSCEHEEEFGFIQIEKANSVSCPYCKKGLKV